MNFISSAVIARSSETANNMSVSYLLFQGSERNPSQGSVSW